ncbi:MAG: ABC transporter substrate-binding protein [Eubacteriales bacterium]|nr:ABC transporter substrate-binding protein [Eubacteriales bacterium]
MKIRDLFLVSSLVLSAALFTGCSGSAQQTAAAPAATTVAETTAAETGAAEGVTVRIGAMSGPTAIGMVKLMNDNEEGSTVNTYEFADLATEASAMVTPLAQGELDIAAVPANLAATLYSKTNGGIQVLAVNALGVLNLLERGEELQSIKDVAGKTVYMTGQSAVPEYTVRYILTSNGIDPDNDVDIHWCADTTEALSFLKETEGAIAILPQPFATAAKAQVEDLRVVQDLNEAWAELGTDCNITTGVTVVRKAFAEENPEAVEAFLKEYADSVAYTADDAAGAAQLIEKYGIIAKAAVAEKALPGCHIVCITGSEMKTALEGFLQVVFDQKAEAVGGAMPGADFYYGAE